MPGITEVRKTYKYRLYRSRRDFRLHDQINIAGILWNHVTALQKRYYRLFGKHISENQIKKHIAKLRMKSEKYRYWRKLGSQAVQDVIERHEKACQRFFARQGGFPHFKKVKKYRSFTLKQAGWKLHNATPDKKYRKITIGKTVYKFVNHRPLTGAVKTVTIKRDAVGRLWLNFSVMEKIVLPDKSDTGKIGAFDFGLNIFLMSHEGQAVEMPQYFKQELPAIRQIQKQVSKKITGSQNQQSGKQHLARRHIRIADKRLDFHFQLAHRLCDDYDTLVFEDLNLAGIKGLWGRKVSDLGFTQFVKVLRWVASKCGKQVFFIDRWERTTGKCSSCGHKQKLELKDRIFECIHCGLVLDRDHNAAINILEAGHRLILSQLVEDSLLESIQR